MPATTLHLRPASTLRGRLTVPGDKSISHRYVMLGAIARGVTRITGLAPGADVLSTLRCMEHLGARVERADNIVTIHGRGDGGGLTAPGRDLDAGNSGTTMRLLAGILAGQPFATRMDGDASLRTRPMRRVLEPLTAMGATCESHDGRAPLDIRGGHLHAIDWAPPVASAQVKSAVLLAGLYASGTTSVHEPVATRDHTERAFTLFEIAHESGPRFSRVGGGQIPTAPAGTLRTPGDPSSAAVWLAAASAVAGGSIQIDGVCLNPQRLGFVRALESMGANVQVIATEQLGGEPVGSLILEHGQPRFVTITPADVPGLIDELPVLAAAAALGGGLEVSGASELRVKESDRITALVNGFHRLGLAAEERPDGFLIPGGQHPAGGEVDAHSDHRLVMAFTIVALGARGPSAITGADCVAVSYPAFAADLERLLA